MKITKLAALAIILCFMSGCATAPKFNVIDDPSSPYTFDVFSKDGYIFDGTMMLTWIEAKAALVSSSRGCTHFRKLSHDTKMKANYWTGGVNSRSSAIYECVDITKTKAVKTSNDTITISDGENIGASHRIYNDIKPVLFRHRDLIARIRKESE
ncbi:hypothetical protein [Arenicella xantha]|uniref:Lipoprotein n=1 Tax=Arenicella xantha TaxID=644221 RepID=A0A395JN60_9GAMM|nr:hypothetical protein [Arenicella xantha]RBP52999.1 hypothetical protein DFR28_101383 [Arenicella xantha]